MHCFSKFFYTDINMNLISKNLKPKFCKKAELKTVGLLASKPVAIN